MCRVWQKHLRGESDTYKSGELHMWQPPIISTWIDSEKARFHPDLLRKATPEEEGDFRIAGQVRV